MNPMMMTESDFGLERPTPAYSEALRVDVEGWLERPLTRAEVARLEELCAR